MELTTNSSVMENKIELSPNAREDLLQLSDVITFDYFSPLTAKRYIEGLNKTINSLSLFPDRHPIQRRKYIRQMYGTDIRRVNYKKMAILYTFNNDVVYIVRIMSGGSIRGIGAAA
ncbi:MAG: type II toxin-antitoxin system RelE/ParE family toxin [Paludibacter sp.]|nr:type II toxin-antitoxin system RelE/ParE family toxin [Bacteroidales bacterium]MCM1354589.1 type II toxin-antitoxin system RelE/ParE family toxin [Bacteroides sp.]MCM1403706.1 type II toxin-antitoxin system RelE/ParE family toxin [Bacteroides sp.]MCM1482567.1 type II toxin-antitoxin system RelE/ParE family toxin [Paludibacter sp.]MCM1576938.1 type II toxin-antitoxin system RelE/ParE family toxin [Bacteroides sp.]